MSQFSGLVLTVRPIEGDVDGYVQAAEAAIRQAVAAESIHQLRILGQHEDVKVIDIGAFLTRRVAGQPRAAGRRRDNPPQATGERRARSQSRRARATAFR